MAKKISNEQILGQRGVALIESRVLDMGYTWHPTSQGLEAGIDGWIELRDPVTGEVSNCWLAVQSKARTDVGISGDYVTLPCTSRDIEYWLSGTAPVLVVLSRPDSHEIWWLSVKDYFRDNEHGSNVLRFHKVNDILDGRASSLLRAIGSKYGASTYFTPRIGSEELISNLIEINGFPATIFHAESTFRTEKELAAALKASVDWPDREWILVNGRIFSFHRLSLTPWDTVCDASTMETIETSNWSQSTDEALAHRFSWLLNQCLRTLTSIKKMAYSKEQDCHYYKLLEPGKPRREHYQGNQNRAERNVVTVFAPEEGVTKYYRHTAFKSRFRRFDNKWYLEVSPTYVFTTDGKSRDKKSEEKLAKIKSLEGDAAVAGTILMLADLLKDDDTLFRKGYSFLRIGEPARTTLDATIDDAAWSSLKARVSSPSPEYDLEDFGGGLFA